MRMFAGFGTAEDTNERFKKLIAAGGTGLSIAYDMPTLYGYDHDDPHAAGEFGTCGVAVSSLADMEILLDGLPVDQISTSMTINSPAAMIWAMYLVAAEKAGVPRAQLSGTLQNDILKEFIAQKEYIFPPTPSLKLVTDTIEFGTREMPRWNTISISGYHIREAGSTAVQELAFTIADGIAYSEDAMARGLRFDDFAPRLSLVSEHLARYAVADLALDTFPYTSHTTGTDALWAGCLMVALCGDTFAARVSGSLVSACGLNDLITYSTDQYRDVALRLANDQPFRREMRERLRSAHTAAPLFDSLTFTRDLENLYCGVLSRPLQRH
jgi:hypothetical protein